MIMAPDFLVPKGTSPKKNVGTERRVILAWGCIAVCIWHVAFHDFTVCAILISKRRRRIDRSMIGEPMNFVHTAHVGSGEANSGFSVVSQILQLLGLVRSWLW